MSEHYTMPSLEDVNCRNMTTIEEFMNCSIASFSGEEPGYKATAVFAAL